MKISIASQEFLKVLRNLLDGVDPATATIPVPHTELNQLVHEVELNMRMDQEEENRPRSETPFVEIESTVTKIVAGTTPVEKLGEKINSNPQPLTPGQQAIMDAVPLFHPSIKVNL